MMLQNPASKRSSLFPLRAGGLEYLLLVIACYGLSFGSFENFGSLGGQDRPVPENLSFDLIAAVKAATRVLALALVGLGLFRAGRGARWRIVRFQFFPWTLLGFWGIASTAWSPMPAYTFGHSAEFLLLVMVAALAALVCSDSTRLMHMFRQMCFILFLYLLALVIMSVLSPASARIIRSQLETETALFAADADTTFIMNPPEIAGIAALGLVLLVAARCIWNWRWSRMALLPFGALGCWIAFITQTRTSIATTVALCGLCFLVWANRRTLMLVSVLFIAVCTAYVIIDPNLGAIDSAEKKVDLYVSRGQSTAELRGLSGRATHWAAIFDGLQKHPSANLIGFGYSMATPTGKLWHEDAYRRYTGHNILLDVYTGTGLIGFSLFTWGFLRLFWGAWQSSLGPDRRLPFLTMLVFLFAFMTGMFGDSIVGPIDPTSVVIFVLLGAGAWRSETTMHAYARRIPTPPRSCAKVSLAGSHA